MKLGRWIAAAVAPIALALAMAVPASAATTTWDYRMNCPAGTSVFNRVSSNYDITHAFWQGGNYHSIHKPSSSAALRESTGYSSLRWSDRSSASNTGTYIRKIRYNCAD